MCPHALLSQARSHITVIPLAVSVARILIFVIFKEKWAAASAKLFRALQCFHEWCITWWSLCYRKWMRILGETDTATPASF